MAALNFSKEELRTVFIIVLISFFGVFINLCSGYSDWAAGSEPGGEAVECAAYPIDINACGTEELTSLPGIGPAIARKVVDYRTKNGGFKTRCEVKNVGGIGERFYERIKDQIFVQNDPTPGLDEFEGAQEENGGETVCRMDINAASAEDFGAIKGLGRKAGEKIIEFRNNNGGRIDSFKQLSGIEGIGKKRLRKLNKYFVIY